MKSCTTGWRRALSTGWRMCAAHEGGEACACDLTEPLALLQPTVSHHLKVLLDAGLVSRDKRGVWAYYRLVGDALTGLAALLSASTNSNTDKGLTPNSRPGRAARSRHPCGSAAGSRSLNQRAARNVGQAVGGGAGLVMFPPKVRRSTMAAQSLGLVKQAVAGDGLGQDRLVSGLASSLTISAFRRYLTRCPAICDQRDRSHLMPARARLHPLSRGSCCSAKTCALRRGPARRAGPNRGAGGHLRPRLQVMPQPYSLSSTSWPPGR